MDSIIIDIIIGEKDQFREIHYSLTLNSKGILQLGT
jgi:hypothetical protein